MFSADLALKTVKRCDVEQFGRHRKKTLEENAGEVVACLCMNWRCDRKVYFKF